MQVFATPGNPMPANPTVSAVRTRDGVRLRVARWHGAGPDRSRGTVLLALGRSEFIEGWFEIVRGLVERGFEVVAFDWRGQGQSDRQIAARHRGHVSGFSAYQRDLLAVEAQILRVFCPKPWFAFGHSMGAAILLDQAHRGASPFERLVLTAPMIDVALRHRAAKRLVIRLLDLAGFGRRFIPGGSERPRFTRGFGGNLLTADPRRYARLSEVVMRLPELAVGSPTVSWLSGAFDLMERFRDPRFAAETVVPTLILAAGDDRIVDTAATEHFALHLRAGRCITIPGARHQLVMERDDILAQMWAAFDAFIPGEAAAPRTVQPARPPAGRLRRLADHLSASALGPRPATRS